MFDDSIFVHKYAEIKDSRIFSLGKFFGNMYENAFDEVIAQC
jgi:hypothetical protein